jgi:hypothetical protein
MNGVRAREIIITYELLESLLRLLPLIPSGAKIIKVRELPEDFMCCRIVMEHESFEVVPEGGQPAVHS